MKDKELKTLEDFNKVQIIDEGQEKYIQLSDLKAEAVKW